MTEVHVQVFAKPHGELLGKAIIREDGTIVMTIESRLAEELIALHRMAFSKGLTLGIVAEEAEERTR